MIAGLTKVLELGNQAQSLAKRRVGKGDTATMIVRLGRIGYSAGAGVILVAWYTGWRNERVAEGDTKFAFPGYTKLKAQFGPSRQAEDVNVEEALKQVGSYGVVSTLGAVEGGARSVATGVKIGEVGRDLQRLGAQVGEHPQFGGVTADHAPNSLHNSGRAIDINGPSPKMEAAYANYLVARYGVEVWEELIWAGENPVSISGGKRVPSSFWGADTWNAHKDHVHAGI